MQNQLLKYSTPARPWAATRLLIKGWTGGHFALHAVVVAGMAFSTACAHAKPHSPPTAVKTDFNLCTKPGVSAWAAEWLEEKDIASALAQVRGLRTLWLRGLEFDPKREEFRVDAHPLLTKIQTEAKKQAVPCIGGILHNTGPEGFDVRIGRAILKLSDKQLDQLVAIVQRQEWNVLQVDIESMTPADAPLFEAFLARLRTRLTSASIRLSVALHAKTADFENEDSKFQRWKELAKIPHLDFAIMAYDYSWTTSAPGPVAPLEWLQSIAKLSLHQFDASRVVFALPAYGYFWKAVKGSWQGVPMIAPEIERKLAAEKGWTLDPKSPLADGKRAARGDSEATAWDDSKSSDAKVKSLRSRFPTLRRFAVWRLGGGIPEYFSQD